MQPLALVSMNPLIPTAWESTVLGIGLLTLVLFLVAFIDIARARHLPSRAQAGWTLLALVLPVAGPLLWFTIGRGKRSTEQSSTPSRQ